jgi:hypothetical protein
MQAIQSHGTTFALKFLPRYSPALNPIEEVWAVWKAHMKIRILARRISFVKAAASSWGRRAEKRREVALEMLRETEGTFTEPCVTPFFCMAGRVATSAMHGGDS